MKLRIFLAVLVLSIGTVVYLTQFGNSEQKAEKYYQSGLALLKEGDEDRAMIQFRNVFDLNGRHHDARLAYAGLLRKRGELSESYGQYLRLVEQYPNDVEGRRALGELAIMAGNWEEAERHVRAVRDLAPDDLKVQAMNAVLDYREAVKKNDAEGRAKAVKTAREILAKDNTISTAHRVLIEDLLASPNPLDALPELDATLKLDPDALELHEAKLRLLAIAGRDDEVGEHLKEMVRLFPDNERVAASLIAWYLRRDDTQGAEQFMRQLADEAGDDPAPRLAVVQLIKRTRGAEAARAELDSLIARNDGNADIYKSMRAVLDFESDNNREAAIAELEKTLDGAASTPEMRDIRVILARMLLTTGNPVGARAEVEKVLAEDPTQVAALKMRANWQIDDDKPDEAILTLRKALDQDPRDPETLTLMARAHERNGDHDLAGERLALAVEAANSAPAQSLRYARFLMADGKLSPAESVLVNALRQNPANTDLLLTLSEIYLRQKDWGRTSGIIQRLRGFNTPEAKAAANSVQAKLLLRQNKTEDSITFLESLIDKGDASVRAGALVVQSLLREGKTDEASAYLDTLVEKAPDDPTLKMLRAGVYVIQDKDDEAKALYRSLIAENPQSDSPVRAFYALLRSEGRDDEAMQVLDAGLKAMPQSPTLNWIKAGLLEKAGDVAGAIKIYEAMYAQNNNNLVVANNLASLLATGRDDAESLDRAAAIAKRLRESKVPAFQDTYGWIQYRRGKPKDAIQYLIAAAKGLPEDPQVQMHLGLTYAALKETDKARKALSRGLDLAKDTALPLADEARKALDSLPTGE